MEKPSEYQEKFFNFTLNYLKRMAATGVRILGSNRPGPGQYKVPSTNTSYKYSIRNKTLNPCK